MDKRVAIPIYVYAREWANTLGEWIAEQQKKKDKIHPFIIQSGDPQI